MPIDNYSGLLERIKTVEKIRDESEPSMLIELRLDELKYIQEHWNEWKGGIDYENKNKQ